MKTLSWLCVLLLATASAFGQSKPMNKDITITGGSAPVIINDSNRGVIAFTYRVQYVNGDYGPLSTMTAFQNVRKGQPPVIPAHGTHAIVQSSTQVTTQFGSPPGQIASAALSAVVFDNGEFVQLRDDASAEVAFDMIAARAKAEKDLSAKLLAAYEHADKLADRTAAKKVKDAVWGEIENARTRAKRKDYGPNEDSRVVGMQEINAQELVSVRDYQGESAALELARGSQRIPNIWRKEK